MYEVQQYPTSELPAEIACQIECSIRLIFLDDAQGEDRFFNLKVITDPVRHFVIVEHGALISHALVGQRTIQHGGESYQLYGVGAVLTYPAFRKEGIGGRVVAAASDYIRASDADIGMLFTYPEIEHFYARYGWEHLPEPGVKWGDPANPQYEADAFIMLLPVSAKAHAHRADFDRGPIHVGHSRW
jgi:predicted N-acetyltransferase YhbS